jgi:hypothetical protein
MNRRNCLLIARSEMYSVVCRFWFAPLWSCSSFSAFLGWSEGNILRCFFHSSSFHSGKPLRLPAEDEGRELGHDAKQTRPHESASLEAGNASSAACTRIWTNEISPRLHRFVSFSKVHKCKPLRASDHLGTQNESWLIAGHSQPRLRTKSSNIQWVCL